MLGTGGLIMTNNREIKFRGFHRALLVPKFRTSRNVGGKIE